MTQESYETRWRRMLRSLEQRDEGEKGLRELALFAGCGGGILGGLLLGWRTVCAVEIDAYCRSVLLARQRDGLLGRFPIWDDVQTFDGQPWRGHVDVVSGGFPCQDISSAGTRTGIRGARSGLWAHFARIVREVRPSFVLVENSPDLTSRGLDVVLGDLAAVGYDADWDVLGARHVGAPHKRDRIWIVASDPDRRRQRDEPEHAEVGCTSIARRVSADADGVGSWRSARQSEADTTASSEPSFGNAAHPAGFGSQGPVVLGSPSQGSRRSAVDSDPRCRAGLPANADRESVQLQSGGRCGSRGTGAAEHRHARKEGGPWWLPPDFAGVVDGLPHRMDRIRATGNAQVPAVVRLAWETLRREAHV